MDRKKALDVLQLKKDASFEEAKQAYRRLAKKYHPDVAGDNLSFPQKAEDRMKEVNLAFRSLSAVLKSKTKDANPRDTQSKEKQPKTAQSPRKKRTKSRKQPEKNQVVFSWHQVMEDFFNFFKPAKKAKAESTSANVKKAAPAHKVRDRKNTARFGEIFSAVCPDASSVNNGKGTTKGQCRDQNQYDGYQKYMALKKKMKAMQPNRNRSMRVEKVEKISPVKPVSGVKR